jgi:hypothetical protein
VAAAYQIALLAAAPVQEGERLHRINQLHLQLADAHDQRLSLRLDGKRKRKMTFPLLVAGGTAAREFILSP